ncbi:MAG: hypothetical protein Q4G45_05385 [Actinomycetia bacterium]|nr:hypothetical protein [Actinomycetes bacterium]
MPATDDDVTDLMAVTDQALGAAPSTPGEVRTVVWPENTVPAASEARIAAYAAQRRVRLVYHTKVGQGEQAHKYSVIIGADGRRVMASSKAHIAPDEQGTGEMSRHQATDAGRVVTSYVCYDMHYPDIVGRLRGADAAYASLDDATYGYLQKQFHTADIALHAAQAGVPVVVASSNGPTFAVDAHGVVRGQLTGSGPAVLVVR